MRAARGPTTDRLRSSPTARRLQVAACTISSERVFARVYAQPLGSDESTELLHADVGFHLRKLTRPDTGDVLQVVRQLKRSVGRAVFDDAARQARSDARQLCEFGFRGGVDVDGLTGGEFVGAAAARAMPAGTSRA